MWGEIWWALIDQTFNHHKALTIHEVQQAKLITTKKGGGSSKQGHQILKFFITDDHKLPNFSMILIYIRLQISKVGPIGWRKSKILCDDHARLETNDWSIMILDPHVRFHVYVLVRLIGSVLSFLIFLMFGFGFSLVI